MQQSIRLHRRIQIYLVSLEFNPEAHVVMALGQRDRVLPDEGVRDLPLRGRTCIADRESADHDRRSVRCWPCRARRRPLPDRLGGEWILHCRRAVKSHIAEARDVHQVRIESVRIRQHKHRVAVQLIRPPAGNVRRAIRRERQCRWRARVEEPPRKDVFTAQCLIDVDCELVFAIVRWKRICGLTHRKLIRGIRAAGRHGCLRTWHSKLPIRKLRIQDRQRHRIDVRSVASDLCAASLRQIPSCRLALAFR